MTGREAKEITAVNGFGENGIGASVLHITHSNFWHYSLQLNVYKAIIERKYGMKVRNLVLVQLHPESPTKNYKLFPCADLSEEVEDMFQEISVSNKNKK